MINKLLLQVEPIVINAKYEPALAAQEIICSPEFVTAVRKAYSSHVDVVHATYWATFEAIKDLEELLEAANELGTRLEGEVSVWGITYQVIAEPDKKKDYWTFE